MLTTPVPLSAGEQAQATKLRQQVAPVLANGVVCAMRDQPADPAAYMAEYLAVSCGGDAARVLDEHKFGQECARLDAELESLQEQIDNARAERARRLPDSADAEALRNAAVASASWSETRRLKRLVRSMKLKLSEPLSPSDWPLAEGVLLVQGPPSLDAGALCRQLSDDFGVATVDVRDDDPLGGVLEALRDQPERCVLLHGYLAPDRARAQIDLVTRRVGQPTALLLVDCAPHVHADRFVENGGAGASRETAEEAAYEWSNHQMPLIESAAREARLPVMRVAADGDRNAAMTNLLVAACAA